MIDAPSDPGPRQTGVHRLPEALRAAGPFERLQDVTTFGGYDTPGGDRLQRRELASTKTACVEPALARQEQRFMDVLRGVERFAIVRDTLALMDSTPSRSLRRRTIAASAGLTDHQGRV